MWRGMQWRVAQLGWQGENFRGTSHNDFSGSVNDRWKDIVILETRSRAGIASAIGAL